MAGRQCLLPISNGTLGVKLQSLCRTSSYQVKKDEVPLSLIWKVKIFIAWFTRCLKCNSGVFDWQCDPPLMHSSFSGQDNKIVCLLATCFHSSRLHPGAEYKAESGQKGIGVHSPNLFPGAYGLFQKTKTWLTELALWSFGKHWARVES